MPGAHPNDVVSICLNLIDFPVNAFSMAYKCIVYCPKNDISRGGGGLEWSGGAQEAVVFSVAEFFSFLGKDVIRIAGTIKYM